MLDVVQVRLNMVFLTLRPRTNFVERLARHRDHSPLGGVEMFNRSVADTARGTGEEERFFYSGHCAIVGAQRGSECESAGWLPARCMPRFTRHRHSYSFSALTTVLRSFEATNLQSR